MTLEEAKRISDLLNKRGGLVHALERIEQCSSITGNINVGGNGYGIHWGCKDNGFQSGPCREIQYIIAGYKADIAAIDAQIESLSAPNFPET